MINETTERHDLATKTETVLVVLVTALVFLFPLFFLPILTDWFELPKQTFLLLGALLALVVWLFQGTLTKKLPLTSSVFFFPTFLLAGAAILSSLLTDNKIVSVTSDPVIYAGGAILLVVASQLATKEKTLLTLLKVLIASGAILAVLSTLQVVISLAPGLFTFATNNAFLSTSFNPTGSTLSQGILLAIILPAALGLCLDSPAKKPSFLLAIIFLALISLGILASGYTLYRQNPILLPQNVGWRIATNTMGQSPTSAFFGVGPGNFIDAFTAYKPIEFNATRFWNLRFTTSSNFYFYLLTTTGIAGLLAFLFLVSHVLRLAKRRLQSEAARPLEKGLVASLVVAAGLFVLLPAPAIALIAFFTMLALLTGYYALKENGAYAQVTPDLFANNVWLRPVTLVLVLLFFAAAFWQLGRVVLADYYFAQSLSAARANRGTDTYNLQIKATTLNPWNEAYRVAYSQTNLALADALAGGQNLSDQQKQTVVALVQQAIREARLAAGLAPKRAADYENLSLIYRGLINFAQGADQWALASQNQAINLDPANPRLRLDLGGIYFALKDYQTAAQNFATAVNLKPDYANAHYNLAQVLKLLNLNDQATQQLQATATLVCQAGNNADCDKVKAEIASLAAAPVATSGGSLATPSAQPTNLPKAQTKPPAKIASPTGELAQ